MVGCLSGLGCDIWVYSVLGLQYNGWVTGCMIGLWGAMVRCLIGLWCDGWVYDRVAM
jgi:hypothetical protein